MVPIEAGEPMIKGEKCMSIRKLMRMATMVSAMGLLVLAAGCTDNQRDPGGPGGQATGATERGGGVTSASPGGPNVGPNQGTGPGGR
jgi:hypothetical protein